jgi:hypothetical protein
MAKTTATIATQGDVSPAPAIASADTSSVDDSQPGQAPAHENPALTEGATAKPDGVSGFRFVLLMFSVVLATFQMALNATVLGTVCSYQMSDLQTK